MPRKIKERLEKEALRRRSPLYQFLYEDYGRIIPFLARYARPPWLALGAYFVNKTELGAGARLPSTQSVRQTFHRVDRDKKRQSQDTISEEEDLGKKNCYFRTNRSRKP